MPVLKNPRHERFAQNLAAGMAQADAYEDAGFKPDPGNACRLQKSDKVAQRLNELLERRENVDRRATDKAIERLSITKEAVLAELAKIGFADIRKAVEWQGTLVKEADNPDGGDVLVIKNIFSNHVRLIGSDEIDADTAAAIAEVRQSPTGGLSIKFHDKQAALVNIGRHLGMFKEVHDLKLTVEASDAKDRLAHLISREASAGDDEDRASTTH